MNRLILSIFLLLSTLAATHSWASGSNTVFLKSPRSYVTDAAWDGFVDRELYESLQDYPHPVYVVRVSDGVYCVAIRHLAAGNAVQIEFANSEPIVFRYDSNLDASIGFTTGGNPVILSEQTVE